MLRYKTETRPGLVALYNIRPGNGAGQFLQHRSPHGAQSGTEGTTSTRLYIPDTNNDTWGFSRIKPGFEKGNSPLS